MKNNRIDKVVLVENILDPELFKTLQEQVMDALKYAVKKDVKFRAASTITWSALRKYCPAVAKIYYDKNFVDQIKEKINIDELKFSPEDDNHAVQVFAYIHEGDHFVWHLDKVAYKGMRYNVLLCVYDDSSSILETEQQKIKIKENSVAIYNGDVIRHRVTPVKAGEKRIILALEYYTDVKQNIFQKMFRGLKDKLIYGNSAIE